MNSIDIIGYIATAILAYAYVTQAIQVWRTKQVRDIALKTFVLLAGTSVLWIIYGYAKQDYPIMLVNILLIIVQSSIITCKLKYDKS